MNLEKVLLALLPAAPYIIWGYLFFIIFFSITYKRWGVAHPILFGLLWGVSAPLFYYYIFKYSLSRNKEYLKNRLDEEFRRKMSARAEAPAQQTVTVGGVIPHQVQVTGPQAPAPAPAQKTPAPEPEVTPEEIDNLFG